jgi:hypothetical protein
LQYSHFQVAFFGFVSRKTPNNTIGIPIDHQHNGNPIKMRILPIAAFTGASEIE